MTDSTKEKAATKAEASVEDPTEIIITRIKIYPRPARPGFAWYWVYETNSRVSGFTSLKTLEDQLRRSFPGVKITRAF